MQDKKKTNHPDFTDISGAPADGRLIALDLGTRKVGIAVSDELQFTVRRVGTIRRKGWKTFLSEIITHIEDFDARALILGLPYNFDGSESDMSDEARKLARNFSLSLKIPVYLHDERTTTYEARGKLWAEGLEGKELDERLDSEAAAIILEDFIRTRNSLVESSRRDS